MNFQFPGKLCFNDTAREISEAEAEAMSRKIYFCGSIRAGRGDADLYGRIVKMLETYGKVLISCVLDCWLNF